MKKNKKNEVEVAYTNHDSIIIGNDSAFSLLGFSGHGNESHPYIIEELHIICEETSIRIENTTSHFVVRDCLINGTSMIEGDGVSFYNLTNGRIENCYVKGGYNSLRIHHSDNFVLKENRFYGADDYAAYIQQCHNASFDGNTFAHSSYGLYFGGCSNLEITKNCIYNNYGSALEFNEYCENNTIASNQFGWNSQFLEDLGIHQAEDHGSNNLWENNEWSDYSGTGVYEIEGSAHSVDNTPSLLEDTIEPEVFLPQNSLIERGIDEEFLIWYIEDDFPLSYSLIIDDASVVEEEETVGGRISVRTGALEIGSHNITLIFTDMVENEVSESLMLSITEPADSTSLIITAGTISVVIYSLVLIELYRRKRMT